MSTLWLIRQCLRLKDRCLLCRGPHWLCYRCAVGRHGVETPIGAAIAAAVGAHDLSDVISQRQEQYTVNEALSAITNSLELKMESSTSTQELYH
jgi:hypothetical protein